MKRGFVFLLFLFLLTSVSAEDWIYNSNSALISVNISSDIQLLGTVRDLSVNLSIYPKTSDFQTVVSQSTEPETDNFIFYWPQPSKDRLNFRVDSQVRTFEKIQPIYSKVKFPIPALASEYQKYLQPSELIDSDNPNIVNKAAELAAGETDQYKLMHKIGKWVKNNIEYDLDPSLVFSSKSASWTLKNKKAVCDELTTLFIALNRAMGIPARFVSGYAYTDDPRFRKGWGAHAWAEVYFPSQGWVPIDVTYGQLGDVDLTHIELRKGPDVTTSSAYYTWRGGEIQTKELDIDISLVSTSGTKISPLSIKASMLKPKVGFGSYNLLEVEITNKQNYYVPATLLIGVSEIIEILGDNINYILLEPSQEKKFYWIIEVEEDLDPKYIYTAYLSAGTLRINDTASLEIQKNNKVYSLKEMQEELEERQEQEEKILSKDISVDCDYSDRFYLNEEQKISCNFTNIGNVNFDNLKICLDNDCKTIDLKINQKVSLVFSYLADIPGEQDLKIRMTGKDISKTEYIHANILEKPEVMIGIENPESAKFDQEFEIKINISEGKSPVMDSKLKIYRNNIIIYEKNTGELPKQFILKMKGSELDKGLNNFRAQVEYFDLDGNKYYETEEFQIVLEKLTFWQNILHFFMHLFT